MFKAIIRLPFVKEKVVGGRIRARMGNTKLEGKNENHEIRVLLG